MTLTIARSRWAWSRSSAAEYAGLRRASRPIATARGGRFNANTTSTRFPEAAAVGPRASAPPSAQAKTNAARRDRPRFKAETLAPATIPDRADVAELVDAHGSGPCGGDPVEVQVLSSASLDSAGLL